MAKLKWILFLETSKWIYLLSALLFSQLQLVMTTYPCRNPQPPSVLCSFYKSFRTPDQYQPGSVSFIRELGYYQASSTGPNSWSSDCAYICLLKDGFPCVGFDVRKDVMERVQELDAFFYHVETQGYGGGRTGKGSHFQDESKSVLDKSRDVVKWSCVSGNCGPENKCIPLPYGEKIEEWNFMNTVKPIYSPKALDQIRAMAEEAAKAKVSTEKPKNSSQNSTSPANRQLVSSIFFTLLGGIQVLYSNDLTLPIK